MKDSTKTLICPACGEEMEKIFIEDKKFFVDICTNGCGGIFFDNKEYKNFDEKNECIDAIKNALAGKTFKYVDVTLKRHCPTCGMKMIKNSTSIKNEITIDECYGCGGKFLDYNELDRIRNEYANEEERAMAVTEYLKATMGDEFTEMHMHQKISKPKKADLFDGIINKFF